MERGRCSIWMNFYLTFRFIKSNWAFDAEIVEVEFSVQFCFVFSSFLSRPHLDSNATHTHTWPSCNRVHLLRNAISDWDRFESLASSLCTRFTRSNLNWIGGDNVEQQTFCIITHHVVHVAVDSIRSIETYATNRTHLLTSFAPSSQWGNDSLTS